MRFNYDDDTTPNATSKRTGIPYSILTAPPTINKSIDEGAGKRYHKRILAFERDETVRFPRALHHMHWMLHNCIVHPILGVAPNQYSVEMHELSSLWLNHSHAKNNSSKTKPHHRLLQFALPDIKHRGWWLFHNTVAHTAIGLLPCDATFKLHDWSANKMNVQGWA